MALFDEVRQVMHHPQIILTAAESSRQQEVVFLGHVFAPGGVWTLFCECVQQSLVGQCGQAALQVQQVGDAAADAGVRVGQSADERARV